MKQTIRNAIALSLLLLSTACTAQGQNSNAGQVINLPKPDMTLRTTLMQALQDRSSERDMDTKAMSDQDLATLLWAANGINRPDGKRTAPSAMNKQDVELFVIRADGAYLWNPSDNTLSLRYKGDLREAVAGRQAFAAKAPVSIVLVTDGARFGDMPNKFGLADAAYVSQNICLIASAEGWACCPRATMDIATLKEKLGLSEKEEPVLNNVVGYKLGKK